MQSIQSRHLVVISVIFVAWKTLLGLIAYASPGIGYDTSSSLLESFHNPIELAQTPPALLHFSSKFVRWDAIYFTQIAARQYVFEQEWAFSLAFAKVVSVVAEYLPGSINLSYLQKISLSGILVSHLAHLGSAYGVYSLTTGLYVPLSRHARSVALGAAVLHILSPAGMFLSAPYTEGLFSFLNISGFSLYLHGMKRVQRHATFTQRLQVVAAGLVFGVATTIRSNGLFSGLPFLYDAVARAWAVVVHGPNSHRLYDLTSLVLGGVLIASGFIAPQVAAYQAYCLDTVDGVGKQSWCSNTIPSIYAWVQERYWNVGVFKYWTLSNLPLFLIAAPIISILALSAVDALWPNDSSISDTTPGQATSPNEPKPEEGALVRLALPQILLAVLALTTYNVQIITRLSSGYPLWYIWLARRILSLTEVGGKGRSSVVSKAIFRFMVVYAITQGGLFVAFLPPA